MESTREASPDWLREFQAPLQTLTTLSSSPSNSRSHEVPGSSKKHLNVPSEEEEQQSKLVARKKGRKTVTLSDSEEEASRKTPQKSNKSDVGTKEESTRKHKNKDSPSPKVKAASDVGEDSKKANGRDPSMIKVEGEGDGNKMEVDNDDALGAEGAEEVIPQKRTEPRVSSRLPLVFADKVHRSKALLECEGEALDFSGDVGAVGRLIVSETSTKDHEIFLDLKGTIYKSIIVPSYTFCVVNFGQSEAKIEAIMDDFIQLQPHSNIYESETMVEGTLDGYSFDSDDEGEKVTAASEQQADQKNETKDAADPKTSKKSEKQSTGTKRKRSSAAKPAKKGGKKASSTKKQKGSKK